MAVKNGLTLQGYLPLDVVCHPLAAELARCYWVIDEQAGPFDSLWIYQAPEPEELLDRQFLEVPECRGTSTTCWRPGTLPRLAAHLIVDEWTYLFAIDAPEEGVRDRAGRIARHIGDLSAEFFAGLDGLADLFLLHVDGWWELYPTRPEWYRRLQGDLPGAIERSAKWAGQPPD